jgi:hypothetical protein
VESKLGPLGTSANEWPIVPVPVIMMMENLVEWRLAGETEVLAENLHQRHFVHHKSSLIWARTRAAAVGSQRLIAWAMARPSVFYTVSVIVIYS